MSATIHRIDRRNTGSGDSGDTDSHGRVGVAVCEWAEGCRVKRFPQNEWGKGMEWNGRGTFIIIPTFGWVFHVFLFMRYEPECG